MKNLESILALGKEEGKLIFIDAYAPWCVPCKKMDREVFNDNPVANYFNKNFTNVRINVNSYEGKKFAKELSVIFLPTMFFMDYDGNIKLKIESFKNKNELLSVGKYIVSGKADLPKPQRMIIPRKVVTEAVALQPQDSSAIYFYRAYEDLLNAQLDYTQSARNYLNNQDNLNSAINEKFILDFLEVVDERPLSHFFTNRDKFNIQFGQEIVDKRIDQLISAKLYGTVDSLSIDEASDLFRSCYPEMVDSLTANYTCEFHLRNEDYTAYAKASSDYINLYAPTDLTTKCREAHNYALFVTDEALLRQGIDWCKKSIRIEKSIEVLETLALLYSRLGQEKKAEKYFIEGQNLSEETVLIISP